MVDRSEAEAKYREYLEGHIGNVVKALELLSTLDIPYVDEHIDELREIVKEHDKSKYEEPEWSAYLHHFYPTNDKEAKMEEEFDVAVHHHINNNKHHWNYWVDKDNNLIDGIDEEDYKLHTIERICDWLSMAAQHSEGPRDYYEANKEFIVEPDYARELCEEIFPKIPEDFGKDMWKVTRGELDESIFPGDQSSDMETLIKLIRDNATHEDIMKIIDKLPDDSEKLGVDTEQELIDYIRKNYYKKPGNFKIIVCNVLRKDRIEYFDDKIDYFNEDFLPMNREVVKKLGKRVKYSKTSNAIEIDTQMTNHDKQLGEGYLTEIKASDIKQKSKNQDPERVRRSRKVKTKYLGMSKFGILNFKTTSQSRNGYHYQTIEFKDMKFFEDIIKSGREINEDDVKKAVKEQDINVWCTDESFTYWAWGHLAYTYDFLYIDDRIPDLNKRIQAPTVNNVRLNGGSCKHILSVIDYIGNYAVQTWIAKDMNKYLQGTKEDKYSKQPEEAKTTIDQVAKWDWSDIEKYTGLDKAQILSDISKTLQVVPSTDKGDILTDLVGEALPEEQQGLKIAIVDRAEELLDTEK